MRKIFLFCILGLILFVAPSCAEATTTKYHIMAYNEKLTIRVREALSHLPKVEEKKMFRGVAFMVDGKMCITVGDNRIMCRIDPALHEEAIRNEGVRTVTMGGREYKGFVHVNEDSLKKKKDFDYWIGLAIDFNKIAKAAKKRKR